MRMLEFLHTFLSLLSSELFAHLAGAVCADEGVFPFSPPIFIIIAFHQKFSHRTQRLIESTQRVNLSFNYT